MILVLSVGRVQRFITEARTTADLRNASHLYSDFMKQACVELERAGATLILPPATPQGCQIE